MRNRFFKLCTSLALSLVLFSTHAEGPSPMTLKEAFDELNYDLNVIWDQKNAAFYEKATSRFSESIALIKSHGTSDQDILKFTIREVSKIDSLKGKELSDTLTLQTFQHLSKSDFEALIRKTMSKSYSSGASWENGEVGNIFASALAGLMIVGMMMIIANQDDNPYACKFTCNNGNGGGYCFQKVENPNFCD